MEQHTIENFKIVHFWNFPFNIFRPPNEQIPEHKIMENTPGGGEWGSKAARFAAASPGANVSPHTEPAD